jgi:hypothetical protein
VYISICPVANVFVCFVCVVLYWYIWVGLIRTRRRKMADVSFYGGCSNRRSYDCVCVFCDEGGCWAWMWGVVGVCVIEVDVSRMFVYVSWWILGLSMPENRSQIEDSEYMALMNSKVEFMKDAVLQDPYTTCVWILAWIIHLRIRCVFGVENSGFFRREVVCSGVGKIVVELRIVIVRI